MPFRSARRAGQQLQLSPPLEQHPEYAPGFVIHILTYLKIRKYYALFPLMKKNTSFFPNFIDKYRVKYNIYEFEYVGNSFFFLTVVLPSASVSHFRWV